MEEASSPWIVVAVLKRLLGVYVDAGFLGSVPDAVLATLLLRFKSPYVGAGSSLSWNRPP